MCHRHIKCAFVCWGLFWAWHAHRTHWQWTCERQGATTRQQPDRSYAERSKDFGFDVVAVVPLGNGGNSDKLKLRGGKISKVTWHWSPATRCQPPPGVIPVEHSPTSWTGVRKDLNWMKEELSTSLLTSHGSGEKQTCPPPPLACDNNNNYPTVEEESVLVPPLPPSSPDWVRLPLHTQRWAFSTPFSPPTS